MKKGIFDKRIPTLFALLILVVIIGVSTLLVQSGVFYIGKAAPETQPQELIIANITDTTFTVAFTTTGQVEAVARLNDAQTGNTLILDDRDKKSGSANKYYSHHITIPGLRQNTLYTFRLLVGGKEYSDPSYNARTGPTITTNPPGQNPLFGKVFLPNGGLGIDTLVNAKTSDSQTITSVTDTKGEFILPTNSMRNNANTNYSVLQPTTPLTLLFYRQSFQTTVTTTFEVAQNLPSVSLEEQYSFVKDSEVSSTENSQLTFTVSGTTGETVSIKRPAANEEFIDQRPTFTGTSYPNSNVEILVPGIIQQQILTRADGSWTFQPSNNIPPGTHTLTINVKGSNNEEVSVSSKFSIFPLGSQVSDSSGQSLVRAANLTSTPTPIPPTPTTRPTTAPTATPTNKPSPTLSLSPTTPISPTSPPTTTTPTTFPTATPTLTPSPTPLPTINYTPTNTPSIAPPGALENTALLTGFSIILIISGIVLLFAL